MNRRPTSRSVRRRVLVRAALVVALAPVAAMLETGVVLAQTIEEPTQGLPRPYHWVSPPPSEASVNEVPVGQTFILPLGPDGTRETNAATYDTQASLRLPAGAFPPRAGQTSVSLLIEPLAAESSPDPLTASVLGNVYRFTATYQPGGERATELAGPATLGLLFPSPGTEPNAFVVASADGSAWRRLPSTLGATAGGYVETRVPSLGMFGAAVAGDSPYPPASGKGGSFPWWAVAVAAVILAAAALAPLPGRRRRVRRAGED